MNVSEIAKELNVQSKEVLAFLQEKGYAYKSAAKKLDDSEVELVRAGFAGKAAPEKKAVKKEEPKAEKPAPKAAAPKEAASATPAVPAQKPAAPAPKAGTFRSAGGKSCAARRRP